LTIPAGTATGSSYVVAKADADGLILETSETNNTSSGAIKIGPDLIVSVLTVPTSAAAGATIAVTDTTKNPGGGTTAATTTTLYLSTNATYEAGDTSLGSRAIPILATLATSAGSTSVTIPAGTAPGAYYILAQADATAAVAETTETNNVTGKAITITP
jgi:subtilase family serine protease